MAAGKRRGIRTVTNADGSKSHIVRWRDGGRHRSKAFARYRDAEAFYLKQAGSRQRGGLADPDAGNVTLVDFIPTWIDLYAAEHIKPKTLEGHAAQLDGHLLPRLGHVRLRDMTPLLIDQTQSAMLKAGVGKPTVRRAMYVLQGILARAETWEMIDRNPVKAVKKPKQRRQREVHPLTPRAVEVVRADFLGRGRLRDATLVSTLAYGGCRPGEGLAFQWSHRRARTMLVEGAVSLGEEEDGKTGNRTFDLLGPLAEDLALWREHSPYGADSDLIFPNADGEPWSEDAYRYWRRAVFNPAAKRAGIANPRPYDLRHSFTGLLIYAGRPLPEVARQAGHSMETLVRDYMHVIEDYDPRHPVDPERAIAEARAAITDQREAAA